MTEISQFTYKEQDVDVLFVDSKLSYIFERKGKRYGNMVKVDGRKSVEVVRASIALVMNFAETLDAVIAQENDQKP